MKRTKAIDLAAMRHPVPAVLALAVVSATLAGCGDGRTADIYASLADCRERLGDRAACESMRDRALRKSAQAGPWYAELDDCEAEFGYGRCEWDDDAAGRTARAAPRMAGWIADRKPRDASCPPGYQREDGTCMDASPAYQPTTYGMSGWYTGNGQPLPPAGEGRVRVPDDAFGQSSGRTRTLSRGGFGRMASQAAVRSGSAFRWGS